jgi:DnaJ-class molecular chaperone
MEHTQDMSLVTLQFRNLMNKYHPDKNTYFNDNKTFNKKSSDIIEAYNLIKNYLEK